MSETGHSADRWTVCALGHVHWGALGAAGLLLWHVPARGEPTYLLQQRSRWVDEGGTWGVPGGAMRAGESAERAADREALEEMGALPAYRVTSIHTQECGGGWTFFIVEADAAAASDVYPRLETDAVGWFTLAQMRTLPLHPGFRPWLER